MIKKKAGAVLFWLLVWQLAAFIRKDSIVFVGPADMVASLVYQMGSSSFWLSVLRSFCCIMGGFLAAFAAAALFAFLSFLFPVFGVLLEPVVTLQKCVPVASFVVLFLLLIGSRYLSVVIVFFMAFPILYTNTGEGLRNVDPAMREMAEVFHMPLRSRFLYLYRPALWPFLFSGSKIAVGMSWKAGVAAEIIGVPSHTIGENLYLSKIYLNTDSLFAWTLVIIVLSVTTEKLILWVIRRTGGRFWRKGSAFEREQISSLQ